MSNDIIEVCTLSSCRFNNIEEENNCRLFRSVNSCKDFCADAECREIEKRKTEIDEI